MLSAPTSSERAPLGSAIRVLVVDDQAIMREGVTAVLSAQPGIDVVGASGDGREAVTMFQELNPDVSIVDLRMSPMDGVQVTTAMRQHSPNARVILLTTYDTDTEVFSGLRAGASSYVLKDIDAAQLVDTIRTVHAGRRAIPPAIAAKLAQHMAAQNLTPRQMDVLHGLAKGQSNLEIAKDLVIGEGTVKAHVKAILQRLGARDRTQALTVALKRGLLRAD